MAKTVLLTVCLFFVCQVRSQNTAADSVKSVVNAFLSAIRNSDGQAVLGCFADSALMQTVARNANGASVIKNDKYQNFARLIASVPAGRAEQKGNIEMVKTDGPLASVWMNYKFYFGGTLTHCGVTSFQLVRVNNLQWKIQYLIDTRNTQRCN